MSQRTLTAAAAALAAILLPLLPGAHVHQTPLPQCHGPCPELPSPDCILSSIWCSSATREMSILIALCMLPRCAVTAGRVGIPSGQSEDQLLK